MHKTLLGVFLLLLPHSVSAETVTLSRALHLGLQQNNHHLASKADATASRAVADLAASRQLPQLDFSEELVWTNEPGTSLFISLNQQRLQLSPDAEFYNDPALRSDFQSRLQLRQSLYDPNLHYGRKTADKQAAASDLAQQASTEQLALNILTTYLDIQRSEAQLGWAEVALEESHELLRLAREREASGTGLRADRLRAEARVVENLHLQLGAQNRLQVAQWQLALQVGSDHPLQIAAPLKETNFPPAMTTENDQRPDLAALKLRVEAARMSSRQAAASWQPQLNVGLSWTLHDRDYPLADAANSWLVNANLRWVLFDGFGRSHASAKARAEERSLRNRHLQALRQARIDQQTVRLQSETLRMQIKAVRAALIATEESYQILRNRYQSGLSPQAELLSQQATLEKYRAELAHSETKLLLSLGEQLYLQGRLMHTLLSEEGE